MPDTEPRVCLVSASGENVFFGEILQAFGDALREQGYAVEESIDCFPAAAEDVVCLFIPHEYGALVDELARPTLAQLRRSVAICTEQPGTEWFEAAYETARHAGAVVDINALGVQELKRRGVAAEHARLGYVPAWDVWRGKDDDTRILDVAFLGRYTDERARLIAECARPLERRQAAVYLTETVRPHVADSSHFLSGARRSELLTRTKVLLNVHQQDLLYLEWHRILSAVLNGCVVLSEHSLMASPLEPDTHFLSARRRDLPLVLEGLLSDHERLREIRRSAYDLVRSEMPMSAAAEVVANAILHAHRNPVHLGHLTAPAPTPMPKKLPCEMPGWEAYANEGRDQLPMRKALADILGRTRRLEQKLDRLTDNGHSDHRITIEDLGPRTPIPPRVSVLLSVFNHADLVPDALRSIALNDLPDVEIVAVDDASTDDSAAAVRRACAEAPWLPARLIRRRVNSGRPAAARNLALSHARADLVFILDSDNSVFPQGLAKLASALDNDPEAQFAYGLIERFDTDGPFGLVSWMDWNPDRLRQGNYIDAMAMIRRSALEAVDGFPPQHELAGWEDFALWLAMAETGMRGIRVPDFIGRYRMSHHSMLSSSSVDRSTTWNTMLRRYPTALGAYNTERLDEPASGQPDIRIGT